MSEDAEPKYDYVHDFDAPSSTTRFRFKSHKRHREEPNHEDGRDSHRHSRKRHRKHRHESSRRRKDEEDNHTHPPSPIRPASPPQSKDPSLPSHLDSEAAFRESLFDAMADDEGADFWSSIYGQPIHTYSHTYVSPETGQLERMTDDEYIDFVRTKMWEKTHRHVLEERARREDAARRAKEERERMRREGDRMEREREGFSRRMEESLRRGEERRAEKGWKEAWRRYEDRWRRVLDGQGKQGMEDGERSIPWPVFSGVVKDVDSGAVSSFFQHTPTERREGKGLKEVLKKERIRWHPDKMQQRFAGGLDEVTIRSVTAVFQLIDDLWTKTPI